MDAKKIKEDAKKIVSYLLDIAVDHGNLSYRSTIRYDELSNQLKLESVNYCRVCCHYLSDQGYIFHSEFDDKLSAEVELHAVAIDLAGEL